MTKPSSYVCSRCDQRVSSLAYRAQCPECGSGLRATTRT